MSPDPGEPPAWPDTLPSHTLDHAGGDRPTESTTHHSCRRADRGSARSAFEARFCQRTVCGLDEATTGRLQFWSTINPYGKFSLDMNTRLDLAAPREAEMMP